MRDPAGTEKTDKGWYQWYESIYYSHGIGISWSGNAAKISAKVGKHPTFSDWSGIGAGFSASLKGVVGLNLGTSGSYNIIGLGVGYGHGFSFQKGKTAFMSIGTTTLLGEPYRPGEIGKTDFSGSYRNTRTYLGGN